MAALFMKGGGSSLLDRVLCGFKKKKKLFRINVWSVLNCRINHCFRLQPINTVESVSSEVVMTEHNQTWKSSICETFLLSFTDFLYMHNALKRL